VAVKESIKRVSISPSETCFCFSVRLGLNPTLKASVPVQVGAVGHVPSEEKERKPTGGADIARHMKPRGPARPGPDPAPTWHGRDGRPARGHGLTSSPYYTISLHPRRSAPVYMSWSKQHSTHSCV
jgi:hypothetical protein